MTTTLQITLTESELATVFGWIDTLRPDIETEQDKIAFLEAHALHLLHKDLTDRLASTRTAEALATENAQRKADLEAFPPAEEQEQQ